MIQDLHSHTYYSFCGKDKPEDVVETAINAGVDLLGICDHNYGIGQGKHSVFNFCHEEQFNDYELNLKKYYDHINLVRQKYADKIKVLIGIEIATLGHINRMALPLENDISFFDYCLLEHLDSPNSITKGDLFEYAKKLNCKVGIAHTDMFSFIKKIGQDPYEYFTKMANAGIFWEMNVNYDKTHNYGEHQYVKTFFLDKGQQNIVRDSGVKLSVGFDGHRVEDYRIDRVKDACERLKELNIPLAFSD